MDFILIASGFILLLAGLAGCIVPFIPGPPLSYLALILLQISSRSPFNEDFLVMWGAITIAVTVLDYWVPIYGTKKFGGSKAGVWGATAGLLTGLFFFPPFGIIIGPFIGALAGELFTGLELRRAIRPAIGSFLGFLAGVFMKLSVSLILSYHFIVNLHV